MMAKTESEDRTWGVEEPSAFGSAIGIGIRPDGTGWATFHDGDKNWNHDFPLTVDDVTRLRDLLYGLDGAAERVD